MYSLYTNLKMSLYFYTFKGLNIYLVHYLMSRRNESILICDINDQNKILSMDLHSRAPMLCT